MRELIDKFQGAVTAAQKGREVSLIGVAVTEAGVRYVFAPVIVLEFTHEEIEQAVRGGTVAQRASEAIGVAESRMREHVRAARSVQ